MVEVYPVLRGSGAVPNKYTPFKWPVLSKLQQLVAKHGLGSPAVVNMLQFLTTEEAAPFDIKQLAKLIYTPVQYMVFGSRQQSSAEHQEPRNLRVSHNNTHVLRQGFLNY